MKIVAKFGKENLAILYVAKVNGKFIEFVESLQPPIPREKKWVLILSTMYGCPVRCNMCDAGTYYKGKISKKDIISQIDYMVTNRYPSKNIPAEKFKVQFARMGEPCLNNEVLSVMKELPKMYNAPGLMPCISTIAPRKSSKFMEEMLIIKNNLYTNGNFQLQFSIHTTDEKIRREIIPYDIWSLEEIASYGDRFHTNNDRKITLNFAAEKNTPLDPTIINDVFTPDKYLIKITPINPTMAVKAHTIHSMITTEKSLEAKQLKNQFESLGFDTIISIGELDENKIGSNCGLHAVKFEDGNYTLREFERFKSTSD